MTKTITERILGTTANIKIIDVLMEGRELDYAVSDIAEAADITRQHAYRVINSLGEYGIVKKTRKSGGIQLYKWNDKNTIAYILLKLQDAMLNFQIKLIEKEQKN